MAGGAKLCSLDTRRSFPEVLLSLEIEYTQGVLTPLCPIAFACVAITAERESGKWRIKPLDKHMADAQQDSSSDVKSLLGTSFTIILD